MEDPSWGIGTQTLGTLDICPGQPNIPPPNPWIDRPLGKNKGVEAKETRDPNAFAPPVRHVLQVRVEATNGLAGFFDSLRWEKQVVAKRGKQGR